MFQYTLLHENLGINQGINCHKIDKRFLFNCFYSAYRGVWTSSGQALAVDKTHGVGFGIARGVGTSVVYFSIDGITTFTEVRFPSHTGTRQARITLYSPLGDRNTLSNHKKL